MKIRPAVPTDLAIVQDIYAYHVLHGLATFEESPPPVDEIARRHAEVTTQGLPYLVAEEAGSVIGYGYCSLYRTRSAYRYSLEDSIYLRHGLQRKGTGKAMLGELIRICEGLGYRQMIAVIGDAANAASIGVHASLGFVRVGTLRSSGFKFGRWVDTVLMQRPLGKGDGAKP